jgi:UDP-2-acetamido-3-amino-2,3-dideoxy-glucuronate N-acetyltransferase
MHSRNLALIGAGYWGKNLARNFHSLGALHTLCDPDPAVLAAYGDDYTGVQKTSQYEAVLADPGVRGVAIAAPAALHHQLAMKALAADKDVYVEKPLCLSEEEGCEVTALAAQRGRILMVGHLLQYHPCIQSLKELIVQGRLGQLYYITSNRLNLGKIRREENALWSFAPHDVSVMLALAGSQLPGEVRCLGGSYLSPGVADTTLTTLQFPGNLRAHIYVSWLNPFKEQKLTVVGSQGMAVFDDTKPWGEKLVLYRDYLSWSDGRNPVPTKAKGVPVPVAEAEPLREECVHFLECCRTRATPLTDGAEGLRVLRVLRAAQASLDQNGEAVTVPASNAPDKPAAAFTVHPTAIVEPGAKIGEGSRIWHWVHVCPGAQVGRRCSLGQNVFVGSKAVIGDNCKIQNNVSVYDNVTLEDDVFCGPSMVFTNVYNPRSHVVRKDEYRGTFVRKGVTLGANCTVVCGIEIGEYAFVAAGAVVNRTVKPYALMAGVPARQIGWMSRHGERLALPLSGEATGACPGTGVRYQLRGDHLECLG